MKKLGWLIPLGVGAFILYSSLKSKIRALDYLQYALRKVKFLGADLLTTKIEITISILNPSSEDFAFDSFFGKVSAGGNVLTTFLHDTKSSGIVIKANSETPITFPCFVDNMKLLQQLLSTVKAKDTGDIAIAGTIIVSGLEIPVSAVYRVSLADITGSISGVRGLSGVLN